MQLVGRALLELRDQVEVEVACRLRLRMYEEPAAADLTGDGRADLRDLWQVMGSLAGR